MQHAYYLPCTYIILLIADDGRGGDGAESLRDDPREVDFSKLDEIRGNDEAGSLRVDAREEAKDSPTPISG
ncbi:unnamed protein product [Didymodactylos carnosus]|uniref:Uncharacterized protein n=1 Tax=Didymodactylos carnosus TaxID=1234261 RepID=A0A813TND0_9BILA|nr:unnamed protein product [Didymodactylos carnosus]CAF0829937.1 unnamed protein product [Didymodactylos carnosus]CAF3596360.1 unnamed protein product [Didymodactylos carnosus]CAF3614437.1 unnamed protein product [Didymodactylos carnosus]